MAITVDRGLIESIMTNEAILRELPALRVFKNTHMKKSACCGRGQSSRVSAISIRQVKTSLLGLPSSKAAKLKKLLGTDELVFHLPGKNGAVTKKI